MASTKRYTASRFRARGFKKSVRSSVFFLPREKKISTRENFHNSAREVFKVAEKKILKAAWEKKMCPRKKKKKPPEKKKILPEKKMINSARENWKSTREKICSKNLIWFFFHAISGTVAGLCYGDFSSIFLMLSSKLYYHYFGLILCAPAAS